MVIKQARLCDTCTFPKQEARGTCIICGKDVCDAHLRYLKLKGYDCYHEIKIAQMCIKCSSDSAILDKIAKAIALFDLKQVAREL